MEFAIIAAGEGSRLAKEGFSKPKPLVTIRGEYMIDRLIRIFSENGATLIRVIVNEESVLLHKHLTESTYNVPLQIITKTTPSSLHSFYEIIKSKDNQEDICLTTTDTVFNPAEFKKFIQAFRENADADAFMAATSYIDDETPLYINVDNNLNILAFEDESGSPLISGGIYCLRKNALKYGIKATESGMNRMRNFQRGLIEEGLNVKAYPFEKIVDVDHMSDIATAEFFLEDLTHNLQ